MRVIAGEVAGHAGPGSTYTPMTLVHATVSPGARLALPWRADYNALVYVLAGRGTVGAERRPVEAGQLAVFGAGDALTMAADQVQESRSPNLEVLVLGGRPIREPVAWMGPFVMNTAGRGHPGVRGLPGRAAGQHPARSTTRRRRSSSRGVPATPTGAPEATSSPREAGGHAPG